MGQNTEREIVRPRSKTHLQTPITQNTRICVEAGQHGGICSWKEAIITGPIAEIVRLILRMTGVAEDEDRGDCRRVSS